MGKAINTSTKRSLWVQLPNHAARRLTTQYNIAGKRQTSITHPGRAGCISLRHPLSQGNSKTSKRLIATNW
jgi:hypothetical protein